MVSYKKICWWCRSKADSREHIFKKSDLKRNFGSTLDSKNSSQFMDDGLKLRRIQGPNSRFVKWEANLCSHCNNSKSSTFDRAYDEFVMNMQPFFNQILKDKSIDLRLIFGEEWKYKFNELLKYYIKHIGCRLSHLALNVPQNIIDFLNGNDCLRDIVFQFEVRPMNEIAAEASNSGSNGKFEVLRVGLFNTVEKQRDGKTSAIGFYSWLTTGWISINYIIQEKIYPDGYKTLENPIIPLEIGSLVFPESLNHLPNIAEKISFLDEFGRCGNSRSLQKYYMRILENKTI